MNPTETSRPLFYVRVHEGETPTVREHELSGLGTPGSSCRIRLRCLPGANAVQVPVLRADSATGPRTVVFRAEIAAEADDELDLWVEHTAAGVVRVTSRQGPVFSLPADESFACAAPFIPALPKSGEQRELDLAVLIDATMWALPTEKDRDEATKIAEAAGEAPPIRLDGRFRLLDESWWGRWVTTLTKLANDLNDPDRGYWPVRLAILAFGDERPADVGERGLIPDYIIAPKRADERKLRGIKGSEFESLLKRIQPTPGGDYVDALADGLVEAQKLGWRDRDTCRKILVLLGDSPGASIVEPLPHHTELNAREHDIDSAADVLVTEHHVEIVSIFVPQPKDVLVPKEVAADEPIEATRRQYRRLATGPGMYFEEGDADLESLKSAILEPRAVVTRGAALGMLV